MSYIVKKSQSSSCFSRSTLAQVLISTKAVQLRSFYKLSKSLSLHQHYSRNRPAMGHFSTQEPSKSLPFENGFTSSTASPEPDLKRKRGYFPYTEDDESNLLGNIKTPAFQSSPGIVRTFQDSIPWYQWKRKSFATPEERVKSFKPPESESESEDEFFDAAEPETQKSEARISETRYIGKTLCQQCSGIEDPSIISEGDKFKGIPKVSKLEARLESGLYSFVEQMRNGLEEVQSGVAWMYKRGSPPFKR